MARLTSAVVIKCYEGKSCPSFFSQVHVSFKPLFLPPESNASNKHQSSYMVASVLHLAKHLWNAERKKEEEEEEGGESRPIPLTHIAQAIPHQGHTNTSSLLESSCLNRQHKLHQQQVGKPHFSHFHCCSVVYRPLVSLCKAVRGLNFLLLSLLTK